MLATNALVPAGIQAGYGQFTLNVYGSTAGGGTFVPGAVVQWNGQPRATTFVSSTQLYATITAVNVQSAGTVAVTVVNPPSPGGTSAVVTFTIFNPPAAPTSLIITYAGNGITGYTGNGSSEPAIDATFNNLQKMVFDSSGNLYVAEYRNHVVRKINAGGVGVSTVAGNGSSGFSGDSGTAIFAQLNGPVGVALDGSNNLYISEYDGNRIRKVNLTTGIITTIAGDTTSGSVGASGSSGDNGQAANALFCQPAGIASDGPGNLYVADHCNQKVRKIATSGIITTVAGNGVAGYFGDGGPATDSPLNYPNDVALDASGNLYIGDTNNHRIRRVDASGNIQTVAGGGGSFGDGGPAIFAQLYYPVGVTVDAAGNLYIADQDDYRIRKVNTLGIITTIAGNGSYGYSGDGGLATSAGLNNPIFVAVDPNGNVYLDSGNNRIRELVPPATSTTPPVLSGMMPSSAEVGSAAFTITVNGSNFVTGAYVQWNGSPRNTTFISATRLQAAINNFDVGSVGTAAVTVFNPGGGGASNPALTFNIIAVPTPSTALIITTVGNEIGNYSGDGGPALFATIHNPAGLAYDQSHNLYIADCDNNVVRKVTPGGTITTFAGTEPPATMPTAFPPLPRSCPVRWAWLLTAPTICT